MVNIFNKFKEGLSKSSKKISLGLNKLILKKKVDEKNLDELEDFLIQSDVGVEVSLELINKFSEIKIKPEDQNKSEVFKIFS